MDSPTVVLLGISLIILFGYLAELIFKKTGVPDLLFLIVIGIMLGPHGFDVVNLETINIFAPVFTTFALVFMLFDGAFNIDLASFAKGITRSMYLTIVNFIASAAVVTGVMMLFDFSFLVSLLVGFILGGVSSAFVIPVLKQLNVHKKLFSVLTLESAMTDVLCIVAALTVLEILQLAAVDPQEIVSNLASLFAIAGFIGIIAGILWIVIVVKIFKKNKAYLLTLSYLFLVYALTEFINGNGAIAALFFGLVLKNSQKLTSIFEEVVEKDDSSNGYIVTTHNEQFFYSHIAFFTKTFFFVYIGLLLDFTNLFAVSIGFALSVAIMFARTISGSILGSSDEFEKGLSKTMFARGLAAAAIAQLLLQTNIPNAALLVNLVYAVIFFTIILSSGRIFVLIRQQKKKLAAESALQHHPQ